MAEDKRNTDENKAIFTSLVMMFSASAMQHLGKTVNPLTNKVEINLDGARFSIDTLAMLREKTRGNLDGDEETLLNDALASLQLNFVEAGSSATASKSEKPDDAEPPNGAKAGGEAGKEPKFRKSYGS